MFIAIDNARFEKLFARHGGMIIAHEVIQRQKTPLPIITYLRELIDAVLQLEESAITDELRKQYTMNICTALSSIYFKQVRWRLFLRDSSEIRRPSIEDDLPAALAATGKFQVLLARYPNRLVASCDCLPSPLEAAAACDRASIVQSILDGILKQAMRDDRHFKTFAALMAAMRNSARQTGFILLDYILTNPRLAMGSTRLLKESVKHADAGFVMRILERRRQDSPPGGLTTIEARHVLKESSCSVLRTLLSRNYMEPNYLDDTTPLTLAIQNHRYDLAKTLLQAGAHVDGVPKTGKLVTALWHAAKMGYRGFGDNRLPGIRFLLQHGADPDIHGDWRSPLKVVEGIWSDAYCLLELAKRKKNDAALRPDAWREFGKPEVLELMQNTTCTWAFRRDTVVLR
jgi:hypothetical protein